MQKPPLLKIVLPLLQWYDLNARSLPWRENVSPYRTLVSEFMLQQTRVETVIPYFMRFVKALPDIRALAGADEQTLLKLWEGLGYYSRARNLQKAARMVASEYGGDIPASYEDLLRLPGVGPYTAGAVASIAFGLPAAAVDGNVLRVISRVTASKKNIGNVTVRRAMEKDIQKIIPAGRAGDFTQALMELGATVCLPGEPACGICPLAVVCKGYAKGITVTLPVRQKKPGRKIQEKTVFVIISDGRLALLRRPDSGLLAGLWSLPSAKGFLAPDQAEKILEGWGLSPAGLTQLPPAKHIFTHIEWRMQGYLSRIEAPPQSSGFSWVSGKELQDAYPLPSAYRAYLDSFYQTLQ